MEKRWSNTTRCFDAYTNATYRERPAFRESLSENVSDFQYWLIVGNFYANQSNHLWQCTSAFKSFSEYWNARLIPYQNQAYSPITLLVLSFINNLPGSYASINNIINSMQRNSNKDPPNQIGFHYDMGRLIRVLTIFEIVELQEVVLMVQGDEQVARLAEGSPQV